MRTTERAALYPQKCLVTGRSDGPFVDFGVIIPAGRDQRLYIRSKVVEKGAPLVGMVPKAEHDELKAQIAAMEDKLADYEAQAEKFEQLVAALS